MQRYTYNIICSQPSIECPLTKRYLRSSVNDHHGIVLVLYMGLNESFVSEAFSTLT